MKIYSAFPHAVFLLLTFLTSLATAAPQHSAKPPRLEQKQPDSNKRGIIVISAETMIDDALRKMTPAQRKIKVNQLAEVGFLVPKSEYWALLDSPKTIFNLVYESGEPFTPPMLDALERTLISSTTDFRQPTDQLRVAEFLYRYRRPAGRNFLVKRFEEGQDPEIADIFAQNQDREMLPWILQSMNKPNIPIESLKDWNTPEINSALLAAFQRDPENSRFGTILSAHNDQRAVPLLWHIYNAAPLPNLGDTDNIRKLYSAAALVRLHVPESNQLMAFLLHQLVLPRSQLPSMVWRMWVIVALGQTGDVRAEAALKQVITHYLTDGVSAKEYALTMSSQDLSPDELAMYAAAALSEAHAVSTRSLIAKLLLRVSTDSNSASKGHKNYNSLEYLNNWDGIAHSLLDLDGSQTVVQQVMGRKWLQRQLYKRTLLRLPDFILPQDRFEPSMRQ